MRRSLALILLALALAWSANAAAAHAQLPTTPPLALSGSSGGPTVLSRHDPLTLAPGSPFAEIPEWHDGYSFSPDGRHVAFTVSTNPAPGVPFRGRVGIRVVDVETMEVTANVQTGVASGALGWLAPRRLVGLLQGGDVVLVDPVTGEVVQRRRGAPTDCTDPRGKGTTARALVFLLRTRLFAVDRDGNTRSVRLRGVRDECFGTAMAVDRERERAYVLAENANVAEVNLRSMRVTYRRVPASRATRVAYSHAFLLGDRRIGVAHSNSRGIPKGVELVDARAGTRRVLDPRAGYAARAAGLLLTFDGRNPRAGNAPARGEGLRAFDSRGRLRFRVLAGEPVWDVQVLGRFAYVRSRMGLRILDLRTRRVVSRSADEAQREIFFVTR